MQHDKVYNKWSKFPVSLLAGKPALCFAALQQKKFDSKCNLGRYLLH